MSDTISIYNLNNIPLFTYGMIGITTVVLAIVTMMDTESNSFAKDEGYEIVSSESNKSMFGNMFAFGSENKPVEEPLPNEENKSVEQESSQPENLNETEQKIGGTKKHKYKNNKTKHNKRQNTYTRKI